MGTQAMAADHDEEGTDFDWLLTRGADMAWYYGFAVQSCLTDMESAFAASDWPTCVAAADSALQAIVRCGYRGMGVSASATAIETHLRLATDPSPAAAAYRGLPAAIGADRESAAAAMAVVRVCDSRIRAHLPWDVAVLRSPTGTRQSMRQSASLLRWRRIRGLDARGDEPGA